MRMIKVINAIAGCAMLAGCAGYQPGPVAQHMELVSPYRLGSGDSVRVIVFGQPDVSNTYAVDQAGNISMPLVGAIPVRDHTTTEVEGAIATRLRAGYVRNPDVSVEVDRYRPFFAMGEVNQAGQYAYVAGMTVQSAIAIAGGFTPRADRTYATVTRSHDGELESVRLNMTDPVVPGDVVYVRERLL